jgi:HD-GYP domain-containing protein (c-di-GMP phosphodiesterase class II)
MTPPQRETVHVQEAETREIPAWLTWRVSRTTLQERLSERDAAIHDHGHRVTEIVVRIASVLPEIDRPTQAVITEACMFHDIGKLLIDPNVLSRSGPLSASDWLEVRTHPVHSAAVLHHLGFEPTVVSACRHHHERWDGTGYPDGLAEDQILQLARMIALADAFDAMTTPRHYRQTWTPQIALAEIAHCGGSQFDPSLTQLVLQAGILNPAAKNR